MKTAAYRQLLFIWVLLLTFSVHASMYAQVKSPDLVTFRILSEGLPMQDGGVLSIKISKELGAPERAEITFMDGSAAQANWPLSASKNLAIGKTIEILLGYNVLVESAFKGKIIAQELSFKESGGQLKVICEVAPLANMRNIRIPDPSREPQLTTTFGTNLYDFMLKLKKDVPNALLSQIQGWVEIQGTLGTQMNGTIELAGFNELYNKKVFVSGLQHYVEAGNWRTRLQIGLSAEELKRFR